MRSAAERLLARDARRLDRLLRRDLRLLQRAGARDLERAGALVGRDAVGVHGGELGDAHLLRCFAGRDLGLLDDARPLDLAAARLLVLRDASLGDGLLLGDPGPLDLLARVDFRLFDRAHALDLVPAHVALGGDARLADRLLVGDASAIDLLPSRDLRRFDRPHALDLVLAHIALGGDARLADRPLVTDPGPLDLLAGRDLRLLGLRLAQRAFAGDLGALHGAADLDVALLLELRGLALALDVECLLLRLEVAAADLDHRVLLDVVAQLTPRLDVLDQPRQALGVEAVRGVEELEIGLVEIGDRDGFELEPVLGEAGGRDLLNPPDILAALLVHLLHGHLGGDGAQGRDELAGEQRVQALLLHGAAANGCGSDRDRLAEGGDAHVEVRLDVDPHPVLRDERVLAPPHHAHLQDVHVDGRVVVDERQHEGAAVDHHPLAEEAGADEGHLLRRTAVEPVHEVDDDRNDDDRDDEPEDQASDQHARHHILPCCFLLLPNPAPRRGLMALNLRVCSVSATSTGSRSIEDAP